jgi:CheY-like chemotaxis protein
MASILLIDDDDSVRAVLCATLTHFGHTVTEARNGKEGLDLYPKSKADLVITDIIMPEKEGLEVVTALRSANPSVKIIAISGGGRTRSSDNLKMARLLGAARVIAKPFSAAELIAAVGELLPGGAGPPP